MKALTEYVHWLQTYVHDDRRGLLQPGLKLQYHPRSDRSSHRLAELLVEDLLDACPSLAAHAAAGDVAYAIDRRHEWSNGKQKKLDFAIGVPEVRTAPLVGRVRRLGPHDPPFSRLLVSVEEKAVATEHGKSQPRVYSELNDSHVMVHRGDRNTIAGGLTWVNIAPSFISPLRQSPDAPVEVSPHRQPQVTASMVTHLRGLPVRNGVDGVGFDAYCTFVLYLDNQGTVGLHGDEPAPQPQDRDHYDTFVARIADQYQERFGDLSALPSEVGLSVEEALARIAQKAPRALSAAAEVLLSSGIEEAEEIAAVLQAIADEAHGRSL